MRGEGGGFPYNKYLQPETFEHPLSFQKLRGMLSDRVGSPVWNVGQFSTTHNSENVQGESKKCDLRRLVQNCTLFSCNSCMVIFQHFLNVFNFLWYFNGPKKIRQLFYSLKIKSSEKQKCVDELIRNLKF